MDIFQVYGYISEQYLFSVNEDEFPNQQFGCIYMECLIENLTPQYKSRLNCGQSEQVQVGRDPICHDDIRDYPTWT